MFGVSPLILKLVLLVIVANGAPIVARLVCGDRWARPLDAGTRFADGERVFGDAKTVRGVAAAVVLSIVAAMLLGFDWITGLLVGGFAMLGDLLSSFIKRRIRRPVSSQALGLDQIPEALLPMLACKSRLGLSAADVALVVGLFFVAELLLSRLHLRSRPY